MKIKILGISGSPRHGNTEILVREALVGAETKGAETEFVSLADKKIMPCTDCGVCEVHQENVCVIKDDMEEIYEKLIESDGLIIGTPVYFGSVSAQLKAMMDRCNALSNKAVKERTGAPLRLKVGGAIAVAAARHGGQENALQTIRIFFSHCDMLPVGLTSPHTQLGATGIAKKPEDVKEDEWMHLQMGRATSSIEMSQMLGHKVAIVAKIVKAGVQTTGLDVPKPYGL